MYINLGKVNYLSIGFGSDTIDHETHEWNMVDVKLLVKLFNLWVYVIGIEIGPEMISVGALNLFVAWKFREASS